MTDKDDTDMISKIIKHKVLFSFLFMGIVFLGTALLFFRWSDYFLHLASHQIYVWTHQQSITSLDKTKFSKKEQAALKQISLAKEFGQKIFELHDSKSYSKFVDLKRDTLGYNITVAPEFSLKPVEFTFPVVGKFSYLGFFDKQKTKAWKKRYEQNGYDVYLSEIGAYSTLGFLHDPIFSTYLQFSKQYLTDLILHEMTHEKLFFKNDILLSETLAVYNARKATQAFFKENTQNKKSSKKKFSHKEVSQKVFQEYNQFYVSIEHYRKLLNDLYQKNISAEEKRKQKAEIFANLKKTLQEQSHSFHYVTWPKHLLEEELNNAALVQIKRYSPHNMDYFDDVFERYCKENFSCFLKKLSSLKKCDTNLLHKQLFAKNAKADDVSCP